MNELLSNILPPLLRGAHLTQYLPNEQYSLPIQSLTINPHTVSKTCDQALVEALAAWLNEGHAYPTVVFAVHDDKTRLWSPANTLSGQRNGSGMTMFSATTSPVR